MIGRLRGILADKSPGSVLIDVGGVGYEAAVSLSTFYGLPEQGQIVTLHVVTSMRETALELFAFADAHERAAFRLLRGVSGIGPRLALAILSGIDSGELARVVGADDLARLISIPGVGRKTAERVLVELRDKMPQGAATEGSSAGVDGDAVAALLALGYKRGDAAEAVRRVMEGGADALEEVIKQSLAVLTR